MLLISGRSSEPSDACKTQRVKTRSRSPQLGHQTPGSALLGRQVTIVEERHTR